MKKSISLITFLILTLNVYSQDLNGFAQEVRGETIDYTSLISSSEPALLVRSMDRAANITWETASIPEDYGKRYLELYYMAGVDVNKEQYTFDVFINDKPYFSFRNPADTLEREISVSGPGNASMQFRAEMIDRHNDFMGIWTLKLPVSGLQKGKPVRIMVRGESAGNPRWFMVFKRQPGTYIDAYPEAALVRTDSGIMQPVRVTIDYMGLPKAATVTLGAVSRTLEVTTGSNTLQLMQPEVSTPEERTLTISFGEDQQQTVPLTLTPVRKRTFYMLHHSHVDIGYTHFQDEVAQIQYENIRNALKYIRESADNPEFSRYKWNPEVYWAVESFLERASEEEKQEFEAAVREGSIGLDALYGDILTGLSRGEELYRMNNQTLQLADEIGIEVNSAMITDVPGLTWGIVPALVQKGIRYMSIGTNAFDRIGNIIEELGDRPFYWESPSGKEKLLVMLEGKGYSWFHGYVDRSPTLTTEREKKILSYIRDLELQKYPYDIISFRYNIQADNGPPDPLIADLVRQWNEKYETPKIRMATTREFFEDFEARYRDEIPVLTGDMTPYWEDGALSTITETSMVMQASDRLVQASTLWTLLGKARYPVRDIRNNWKNIHLFNEHTWGAWNSVSNPEDEFAISQWQRKASFARNADEHTRELMEKVIGSPSRSLIVYNTESWPRRNVVKLPDDVRGTVVRDMQGNTFNIHTLASGERLFIPSEIPGFGMVKFSLLNARSEPSGACAVVDSTTITNGKITLTVDPEKGTITSLRDNRWEEDLVDPSSEGLNQFIYTDGLSPENTLSGHDFSVEVKENSPLCVSLLITGQAPGTNGITSEIILYDGLDRVDIINTVDKPKNYQKEAFHYAFPFYLDHGTTWMDIPWGKYRPEKDQLKGANRNFFSVERGVDILTYNFGITLTPWDSPLVETGRISVDPKATGWQEEASGSQRIFSYVMNNYWHTNYQASQSGIKTFRYSISFHNGRFSSAEEAGRNVQMPLLAGAETPVWVAALAPPDNPDVIVTAVFREGTRRMARIFNAENSVSRTVFNGEELELAPFEVRTVTIK